MNRHAWLDGEPTLDEALADPVVHLVMQRDGLTEADVREALMPVIVLLRPSEPETRRVA